ncbi:MAG: plasma-membrane proton-efflux P-type ATPase [Piscirickettsiaceae bacterium]|nr:MAG: plasma-membrane proton-efflux P-type ATPase [Piscirickettsiaceae bacterium]
MKSVDSTSTFSSNAMPLTTEQIIKQLGSTVEGLSSAEAKKRLLEKGENKLEDDKRDLLKLLLNHFWGPIPWMIEAAALLSAIVQHWADFVIISTLLLFNAAIGFWQSYQAGNAVDALKKKLALNSLVNRDASWQQIEARFLVPGDLINLKLGDIIPADCLLIEGEYLSVDQAALTGESLPVARNQGDLIYSGTAVTQGKMTAMVSETGKRTFLGKTASLVSKAHSASHFQKAILKIGNYLIYISLTLVALLIIVQLYRGVPIMELIQFSLILVVASIPVAMPVVLSVTMAIGALKLSKLKAIVTRLESIEELAGIDILCSDKTGTLTLNQLTLGKSIPLTAESEQSLILYASLASEQDSQDAIDKAVLSGLEDSAALSGYKQLRYSPYNPVDKRSEAEVLDSNNHQFRVSKGAPQVILALIENNDEVTQKINTDIEVLAKRGYRALGVASTDNNGRWQYMGLLALFDPPREDSAKMIREAKERGVQTKMITGDNIAIAIETAKTLGMSSAISTAQALFGDKGQSDIQLANKIEASEGLAEVFPEHKFAIVHTLQEKGHIVAMTGDGVNDAPALKQADMGIAVSGATDAARAAADLVLTHPGLSVIISAIDEARRIFGRMNAYAIYRITETIRIMIFMVLAMTVYEFYPLTPVMIILLALLNDFPIMTIAYDNTWLDPKPVRWKMERVLSIATVLGIVGVISSFGLLVFAEKWLQIAPEELQVFIFLKMSVAGHLTLFVARTKKPFYSSPHPSRVLFIAIISTQIIATIIVINGWLMPALSWGYAGLIWAYAIIWMLIADLIKVRVYHHLDLTEKQQQSFLKTVKQPLGKL